MDDEKKKVKQAIALEYDPSDEAPRVVASGKGILADKIIEKARESSAPQARKVTTGTARKWPSSRPVYRSP